MPKVYIIFVLVLTITGFVSSLPLWNALQAPYPTCDDRSKITNLNLIQMATDSKGNIWLFEGRDPEGCNYPVQLRYFDITTSTWTVEWDSEMVSEIAGPQNKVDDSVLWVDKNDGVWIYGGRASGDPCEFWLYNTSKHSWSNLTPANTAINYGTKGSPSDTTYPSCRRGMVSWYTDDDNSLWMSHGLDPEGNYLAPAMWRYQIDLGQWSWYSGPDTPSASVNAVAGDFSFDNYPGNRWGAFNAVDEDNNLWLFAGETDVAIGDDLWVFNRTNGWKRLGGSDVAPEEFIQPVNSYFSANNWPAGQAYNSLVYAGNGMLAMLTGYGSQGYYEEDWYYDILTNQWARTYNTTTADAVAVADVLSAPDESTRPGSLYWSRTVSKGKIWAIGDRSRAVMVKELTNGDFICELNPACHADATCVTGTGCVCSQGFDGPGRGPNGCVAPPVASPVAAPVTAPASGPVTGPVGTNTPRTSSGSALLVGTGLLLVSLIL